MKKGIISAAILVLITAKGFTGAYLSTRKAGCAEGEMAVKVKGQDVACIELSEFEGVDLEGVEETKDNKKILRALKRAKEKAPRKAAHVKNIKTGNSR